MNLLLASLLNWLCLALAYPSLALAQAGATRNPLDDPCATG